MSKRGKNKPRTRIINDRVSYAGHGFRWTSIFCIHGTTRWSCQPCRYRENGSDDPTPFAFRKYPKTRRSH